MALYISKIQLPGQETQYLLKDSEGRAIIAPDFSTSGVYAVGDHVIYNGNLYRFHTAHSAGAWNSAQADLVTVDSEIQRLESLISDSGLRYIGQTYTDLYDGCETASVNIVGSGAHTAKSGDIVYYPLTTSNTGVATYASGTAISIHKVIRHNEGTAANPLYRYYRANKAITAEENEDFETIEPYIDYIGLEGINIEFLFNGSMWNEMGGATEFGSLAYKDIAQGTLTDYATGVTGTISKAVGTIETASLVTTTIRGVNGTEAVSKMIAGTAVEVAKVGTAVRYGTANVGTAVTYGTANKAASATTVGNADVGTAVTYGNANVGTAVTVAKAGTQVVYGNADVGTAVTYGNANVGTAVTGVAKVGSSKTFATTAYVCSVPENTECLTFVAGATDSVIGVANSMGVTITPAVTSLTTLTPAKAADTTRKLTPVGDTVSITPAVTSTTTLTPAVASTTSIYGAVDSTSTLTPAVAAPNNQTLIPAVSNGTITPWAEAEKTVAKAAAHEINVATGQLNPNGSGLVTGVGTTTENINAQLTTGTKTVTVK